MAWSSFEKDKLIIERFRDFFKKKGEPAGTYPASELTTIINLISNLAKKLNIEVDTSAIVDEFEAALKSENYNLQEQEDKIMIGGDVPLDLTKTPNLQVFVKNVAQANKRGLGILLKALERGAFKVSGYESVAPVKQAPKGTEYEPYGAVDATPEKRADNLVVKQKGNFDAETGSPISEEGRDSIIKQIASATEPEQFYVLYQRLANSKFSDNDKKDSFNTAFKNRDYKYLSGFGAGSKAQQIIRQKFIDLFLSDETKPDNSQQAPAQTAVDLLNKIDAEGQEEITVELFNDFVRDLKSFIGEINKQKRNVSEINRRQVATKLNIDIRQLNNFIKKNDKYKLIFNRLRFANKDENVLNSFLKSFEQVAKSLPADTPANPAPEDNLLSQLGIAINNLGTDKDESEPEPTPAPESEPARQEEDPKQKTEDPTLTRRTTKRIKDYYNNLATGEKLSYKFNEWKEPIEKLNSVKSIQKFEFDKIGGKIVKRFDSKKNGLYLITLTNGEQFGLPKHTQDVYTLKFAFDIEGDPPGDAPLNKVIKLAKIKDGKIIQKGEITWGQRGSSVSESILNESLMLRWKTIAGIK